MTRRKEVGSRAKRLNFPAAPPEYVSGNTSQLCRLVQRSQRSKTKIDVVMIWCMDKDVVRVEGHRKLFRLFCKATRT